MREDTRLPPIPEPGVPGSQSCATIRLYLAIIDDLPFEQAQQVLEHVYSCPDCERIYQILNRATRMLETLGEQVPSPQVDLAVRAAIAARSRSKRQASSLAVSEMQALPPQQANNRRNRNRVLSLLGAAAAILLFVGAITHLMGGLMNTDNQAFTLPSNLSWNGYVVYYQENKMGSNGQPYQIETYHNLGTGQMHVETQRPGKLDVVVVSQGNQMLGLDMMHHVAQLQASQWDVDDSLFDLASLRADLQAGRATYLGKTRFDNRDVYQIRGRNAAILLLDMQYHPVNALIAPIQSDAGVPMYTTFKLIPTPDVPKDMWDMSMPSGFQMGNLPPRP